MLKLRKILLTLICLFVFQTSNAIEFCGLEGDFVPWPWSETFNNHITGQSWIVIDQEGNERAEINISRTSFLWGSKKTGLYSLVEKDLNGVTKWGMASHRNNEAYHDLKFSLWFDGQPQRRQYYTVSLGYWNGKPESLPMNKYISGHFANNNSKVCRFFKNNSALLIGLVIEVETYNGNTVTKELLYGLTKDPIFVTE